MSMRELSIFYCLSQYLSLEIESFYCRSLLSLHLGLFLDILFVLCLLWMEIVYNLAQCVCWCCIEKLEIFENCIGIMCLLLKLLISRSFLAEFLGSFLDSIMLSADRFFWLIFRFVSLYFSCFMTTTSV